MAARSTSGRGAARASPRARRSSLLAVVLPPAVLLLCASPSAPSFAAARLSASTGSLQAHGKLCGGAPFRDAGARPDFASTPLAAAATLSWMNPTSWGSQSSPLSDRLSPREWLRMYRTLGLPEDATRQQVTKASSRLRKKYAEDEPALERVEAANLWIMTKMMAKKEERVRQQANRLRELGDSPRRLFQKYIAGYVPLNIRQMIEPPDTKHFRWASSLLGIFTLIGLCVPTQASNFVALSAASTMGLVYQRNRPEPVKDEGGNVGRVEKPKLKEMGACIVLIALGVGTGALLTTGLVKLLNMDFQSTFLFTTCFTLWLIALFFKVYETFDEP
eukprot:CAMPEP_0115152044 /NCGR_PEP_ID=MMETSP0227-20121206/65944_1 /TAXON_ID=89957 /ORGANISM="Polarella glacialis, Strain CCMP 1383" /LENGTH=332 /DNA_ID=CAMNT_0002562613 /DNA_START=54 /DNA_END=1052 /DNA_ORIENTATION=+